MIIPPPTEALMTDDHREDANSTPGQMSGEGSVSVNTKRPVVKMTAINFIGGSSSGQPEVAKVSNFSTMQQQSSTMSGSGQFSFHHPN